MDTEELNVNYKGYELPDDRKYHKEHCWLKLEGGDVALLGWTDFAQKLAKEISSVLVPEEGSPLVKDKYIGTIETGKWVGKIYAPIDGEVMELNEDVQDDPRLVNEDPYGNGWIMKVKLSDPCQVDQLVDATAYIDFIDSKLKEIGME